MSEDGNVPDGTNEDTDDAGPPAAAPVVSRRQALRVLGAVPVAAALGSTAWAQQGQQGARTPHATPNQPATDAPQPPKGQAKRGFFTAKESRTVGVLADDVIPRDARGPSATEAGVPAFMDFHLSVPETGDDTRVAMRGGLAWLDTESRTRFGRGYAAAAVAQRHQILDDIAFGERVKPEFRRGAAFFARFRDMVASGYFSSAAGWKDLRYAGNVFNPEWNGCPQPALDKLGVNYSMMTPRVAPQ